MIEKLKKHYFIVYTILFVLISMIAFHPFLINDRSFIWIGETKDGLVQHYNALMYFGKWGREIIKGILQEHTLDIPLWDFSIGYGSDIISSLHYYGFGDPLNLLSILVPSQYTEYLYDFLVVLRVYLSGFAFSAYCFYMKKEKTQTLISAIVYAFSGYALYAAVRHPFFINPMIYLPLLFIGAEKIMKRKKATLLIGIVFLMTMSNFYFSYMCLMMLIVYVGVRFFTRKYENLIKEGVIYCIKFGSAIVLGLMMSCTVFLPVVKLLFAGERLHSETAIPLFYKISDYERTISQFVTSGQNGNWVCLGFAPIALVSIVFIFLKKKKYLELKVGTIVLTAFLIFPIFGSLINGMSYVSNRWTFAYAFLVAYILAESWEDLLEISVMEQKYIAIILGIYFSILLVIKHGTNENSMATLVMIGLVLLFLALVDRKKKQYRQIAAFSMLLITVLSIGVNVKYRFDTDEGKYIQEFIDRGTARKTIYQTGDYAVRETVGEQKTIERIDQPDELVNSAWQNRTYGINYFCSMENGAIGRFMKEMGNEFFYTQSYRNLDSRTMLNELVAVKYFTDEEESSNIPFGYKEINQVKVNKKEGEKTYKVFENQYALPLGVAYDKYISKKDYESLTPIQKQQALLQGVLLESETSQYEKGDMVYSDKQIDYTVECSEGVMRKGDQYIATKDNAKLTLYFDGEENCETYVYFPEIDVEEKTQKDFYFGTDKLHTEKEWNQLSKMTQNKYNDEKKYFRPLGKYIIELASEYNTTSIRYLTKDNPWSHGQKEYVANMGYHDKALETVTITLPKKGIYSFENMQVICQPMTQYINDVEKLSQDCMKNEEIGVNSVSGRITLDKDKILYLSIPYCEGWSAYVDGKEVELLQGNSMGMAIMLSEGEHEIELKYLTPGLKEGLILSGIAFTIFLGYMLANYIFRKSN